MSAPPPGITSESTIDWVAIRDLVRRQAQFVLGAVEPDDLDDITQGAMVRVLRSTRTSEVKNPEGMATVAARRAVQDWLRARRRWRLRFEPLEESEGDSRARASETAFGDPLERVRFVVLEFFREKHAPCFELAGPYFASRDWAIVARELSISHEAARKRWSRCVDVLRASLRSELAPLFEAFRDETP